MSSGQGTQFYVLLLFSTWAAFTSEALIAPPANRGEADFDDLHGSSLLTFWVIINGDSTSGARQDSWWAARWSSPDGAKSSPFWPLVPLCDHLHLRHKRTWNSPGPCTFSFWPQFPCSSRELFCSLTGTMSTCFKYQMLWQFAAKVPLVNRSMRNDWATTIRELVWPTVVTLKQHYFPQTDSQCIWKVATGSMAGQWVSSGGSLGLVQSSKIVAHVHHFQGWVWGVWDKGHQQWTDSLMASLLLGWKWAKESTWLKSLPLGFCSYSHFPDLA